MKKHLLLLLAIAIVFILAGCPKLKEELISINYTSPSNGATGIGLDVVLTWTANNATSFDVYFGTNSNPPLVATNQTAMTYSPAGLNSGTTYYWKVVAKGASQEKEGPVWSFTTLTDLPDELEGFVFVERGTFWMGDEHEDLWESCRPVHKVTLTYDFLIGKFQATFDEYDAFCDDTGRTKPYDMDWGRGPRPVINVSWWDAIAYCNWLSKKEGLPRAYDDEGNFLDGNGSITTDPSKVVGYRLPTEAEWEFAARGRTNQPPYKYAGSSNVDEVAWYWENSQGKTWTVGLKEPNAIGLYDMSGNVWEWCSDWFATYNSIAKTNPYNATPAWGRVMRGGSWLNFASLVRVAYRSSSGPSLTFNNLGFRITRTVP